ncbi:hypothetical protein AcV7_006905 [Taiwanofungus camphoratus]|nr:hypothetical protein AcV7_006905 [Antrodia cinnamomea]
MILLLDDKNRSTLVPFGFRRLSTFAPFSKTNTALSYDCVRVKALNKLVEVKIREAFTCLAWTIDGGG